MEKSCFQIFKSGAHNGQKKNKLRTVHMRVITIGFLCFKTLDHSISGKNPANNCKNFFMIIPSNVTHPFMEKIYKQFSALSFAVSKSSTFHIVKVQLKYLLLSVIIGTFLAN